MKAAERQRTECATIVAQCKRPQGRVALGRATPMTPRPLGRNKNTTITYPPEEYSIFLKDLKDLKDARGV